MKGVIKPLISAVMLNRITFETEPRTPALLLFSLFTQGFSSHERRKIFILLYDCSDS